jgi:hypothetical protein
MDGNRGNAIRSGEPSSRPTGANTSESLQSNEVNGDVTHASVFSHWRDLWINFALVNALLIGSSLSALLQPLPGKDDRQGRHRRTSDEAMGGLWAASLALNIIALLGSMVSVGELLTLRDAGAVNNFTGENRDKQEGAENLLKRVERFLTNLEKQFRLWSPSVLTVLGALLFAVSSAFTAVELHGIKACMPSFCIISVGIVPMIYKAAQLVWSSITWVRHPTEAAPSASTSP